MVITAITAVISVPIGLLTAIYLVEYGRGRLKRAITFLVDVMTGIPSIVAGLFAFALFAIFFGPGVRLGISCVDRTLRADDPGGRAVVGGCPGARPERAARGRLRPRGVPKWRTVVKVVLPTAIAGLATGGHAGRSPGWSARPLPLLITVGIIDVTDLDPFEGRMATLPVFAYYQLTQPGFPPEFAIDRALIRPAPHHPGHGPEHRRSPDQPFLRPQDRSLTGVPGGNPWPSASTSPTQALDGPARVRPRAGGAGPGRARGATVARSRAGVRRAGARVGARRPTTVSAGPAQPVAKAPARIASTPASAADQVLVDLGAAARAASWRRCGVRPG